MAIPSSFVILDAVSGTVISASDACAIDVSALTDDQRDALENGTDTDRLRLSDAVGVSLSVSDGARAIPGAATGSPAAYLPGCAVRYAPLSIDSTRRTAQTGASSDRRCQWMAETLTRILLGRRILSDHPFPLSVIRHDNHNRNRSRAAL